jgi:hypothetical protein
MRKDLDELVVITFFIKTQMIHGLLKTRKNKVVCVMLLLILGLSILLFIIARHFYPLFILNRNLMQFSYSDLDTLIYTSDGVSEVVEAWETDAEGNKIIDNDNRRLDDVQEIRWTPNSPFVDIGYDFPLLKHEWEQRNFLFKTELLSNHLYQHYHGAEKLEIDEKRYWHIVFEGRLLREQMRNDFEGMLNLMNTKFNKYLESCELSNHKNVMMETVGVSQQMISDLEFYIDRDSLKISRIVFAEPEFYDYLAVITYCDEQAMPTEMYSKIKTLTPTSAEIVELKYKNPVLPESAPLQVFARFIFEMMRK